MIRLDDVRVFLEVIATGSFSESARRLKMPKSSVTRQIDRLETTLGEALFARTGRAVVPTPAANEFLPYARRAFESGAEAEGLFRSRSPRIAGRLTVSATGPFARNFLVPHLPRFLLRHPDVQVALWLTPARIDVGPGEGQVDMAIRLRSSAGPDLANRKLGEIGFWLVAAPGYVDTAGAPRAPEDLERHVLIETGPPNKAHQLELRRGRDIATVRYRPRLQIDDPEAVCMAAQGGAGVAVVPQFIAAPAVAAGRLVRLLPEWAPPPIPVNLLYRTDTVPPPRVRAYADYLAETVPEAMG